MADIWKAKSVHCCNSDKLTMKSGLVRYLQNLAMLLQRCLVAYAVGARKKRIAITCRPHRLLAEAVAQCDVVHADHSTANLHRHLSFATTALSHRQYHLLQMMLYMCVVLACTGRHPRTTGHYPNTLEEAGDLPVQAMISFKPCSIPAGGCRT